MSLYKVVFSYLPQNGDIPLNTHMRWMYPTFLFRESFRLLKYFHGVAKPALLCHREPAQATQSQYNVLGDFHENISTLWGSPPMRLLDISPLSPSLTPPPPWCYRRPPWSCYLSAPSPEPRQSWSTFRASCRTIPSRRIIVNYQRCSHWSSSYDTELSLVKSCRVFTYFHSLKGPIIQYTL